MLKQIVLLSCVTMVHAQASSAQAEDPAQTLQPLVAAASTVTSPLDLQLRRADELESKSQTKTNVGNGFYVASAVFAAVAIAGVLELEYGSCNGVNDPCANVIYGSFGLVVGGAGAIVSLITGSVLHHSGSVDDREARRLRANRLSFSVSPVAGKDGIGGAQAGVSLPF